MSNATWFWVRIALILSQLLLWTWMVKKVYKDAQKAKEQYESDTDPYADATTVPTRNDGDVRVP